MTTQTPWLDIRRKRVWSLLVAVIYTLVGFWGVPALIKSRLPGLAQDQLGRSLSVGDVQFNPFVFTLRLHNVVLDDKDGTRIAGLGLLHIDVETRSLIEWALTFAEIRLEGLYLSWERFGDGSSRLSRLLEDLPAEPAAAPSKEAVAMPRFIIDRFSVSDGALDVVDNLPVEAFTAQLRPIDITIEHLSSLPDGAGRQTIDMVIDGDKTLRWRGDISLVPLHIQGHIAFDGINPSRTLAYIKHLYDVSDLQFAFDIDVDVEIGKRDEDLSVRLSQLSVVLDGLQLQGLEPRRDIVSVERIALRGASLAWPEQRITIETLQLDQPRTALAFEADGSLDLAPLLRDAGEPPSASLADDPDGRDWSFSLEQFRVADAAVSVRDNSHLNANPVLIEQLNLRLDDLSLVEDGRFPLGVDALLAGGGRLTGEGELGLFPALSLALKTSLAEIPLSLAEPYLASVARVVLPTGSLDVAAEVDLQAGRGLDIKASLAVNDLNVAEAGTGESVLAWKKLSINSIEFLQRKHILRTSELVLDEPSGRFHIAADGSNNIGDLLIDTPSDPSSHEQDDADVAAEPLHATLVGLKIKNGRLDFADESLPLPFATDINSLNGRLSALDNRTREPVRLEFDGHVAQYGMARIKGHSTLAEPLRDTDIEMEFRNIKLADYTPYSIQFAGRKINSGDLDITLGYAIEDAMMKGNNTMLIKDFELGENVDQPDALDLPLDLAVALLTKPDGSIDLALPVSGDVNDPQFGFADTIRAVLSNAITKMVTAPFRLLGALVGMDDDDLGRFEFLPGRHDLTPPEKEQATKLAQALLARPQIKLTVLPGVDAVSDGAALRQSAVEEKIRAVQGVGLEDVRANLLLDADFRKLLESMFDEAVGSEQREALRQRFVQVDEEGEPSLDRLAYLQGLFDELVRAEPLPDDALAQLGQARAQSIIDELVSAGLTGAERVSIGGVESAERDGDWVITALAAAH